MRTSKISQETTRIFNALSPNSTGLRRTTRNAAKSISSFAHGYDSTMAVKDEQLESSAADSESTAGSTFTTDIEDAPNGKSRKRKYGQDPTGATVISTVTETNSSWTPPRKRQVETEEGLESPSLPSRAKAKPKVPARKKTEPDGTVTIHPPSNWQEMYSIIHAMRRRNPTAPVDTMGCEDLFWPSANPVDKRYHTLTSLMLSSQTKDTVTAVAMQRLHTELVPQKPGQDGKILQSSLTVSNMLACTPEHLDSLINKVGFHNNKTKFIKAAAKILQSEYNGDIPSTVEGLMRLPGVGPKMAYLCMSAAWGIDEGIGVDVHVHRITNLWGWHTTKNPEESRMWLEGWLPKEKWHEINKMLVGLGQTVCLPVGRRCGECDLAGTGLCKAEIKGWKAKERRTKIEKVEENGETNEVKKEKITVIKEELVDS